MKFKIPERYKLIENEQKYLSVYIHDKIKNKTSTYSASLEDALISINLYEDCLKAIDELSLPENFYIEPNFSLDGKELYTLKFKYSNGKIRRLKDSSSLDTLFKTIESKMKFDENINNLNNGEEIKLIIFSENIKKH